MKMTITASIEVPFKSERLASEAQKALLGELSFQKRASTSIARKRNKIIINIAAEDISALHASTSSFMRALKVILEICK